jgi:hypothetical protein
LAGDLKLAGGGEDRGGKWRGCCGGVFTAGVGASRLSVGVCVGEGMVAVVAAGWMKRVGTAVGVAVAATSTVQAARFRVKLPQSRSSRTRVKTSRPTIE